MQGLTSTSKVTKFRYKKIDGKFVPIAKDGVAFNRKDHPESEGVESLSPADFAEEYYDEALSGEERHQFEMVMNGSLDDFEFDSESPFI